MALQRLVLLVLGNVGKHLVMHLVCSAIGYSGRRRGHRKVRSLGGSKLMIVHTYSKHTPFSTNGSKCAEPGLVCPGTFSSKL